MPSIKPKNSNQKDKDSIEFEKSLYLQIWNDIHAGVNLAASVLAVAAGAVLLGSVLNPVGLGLGLAIVAVGCGFAVVSYMYHREASIYEKVLLNKIQNSQTKNTNLRNKKSVQEAKTYIKNLRLSSSTVGFTAVAGGVALGVLAILAAATGIGGVALAGGIGASLVCLAISGYKYKESSSTFVKLTNVYSKNILGAQTRKERKLRRVIGRRPQEKVPATITVPTTIEVKFSNKESISRSRRNTI